MRARRAATLLGFLAAGLLTSCVGVADTQSPTVAGAPATSSPTPTVLATPPPVVSPSPAVQTYVVASGDTFARIAAWFHMAVEELLAANPSITDPNRIAIGDLISVPVRSIGTVVRIDGPGYRHLRLGESADLVAIGSPQLADEVVHWQVAEANAEPSAWGPGQEWRYLEDPNIEADGRSSPVLAEWPNSQPGHVWRAYRAWVEASPAHPEYWTQVVVVEWGGTGSCPAADPGYAERLVASDGTTYATIPGEDAEYNSQWTLVATNAGGTPGAGWRHVLEACWEPYEVVVGKDATVYLSAAYRTGESSDNVPPMRRVVAGPEGVRSERELAWADLERAPDGTVFAIRTEVSNEGPYEPTWHSMTVAALGPDGDPRPGWPFTTMDPSSRPAFGGNGTVYLAQAADAGDRIVALGPDGKVKEGWPYAVPGELKWTVCGAGCANVPDNPQVAAGGMVYDSFDSGIYIVGPDGQSKEGWPYFLPKGTSIPSACRGGTPGCESFDPIMADDGRVYVPWYDERSGAPHDDLVCITPGGTLCPGWPIQLPGGAVGSLAIDPRGYVEVSLGESPDSRQAKITVRPDGTIVE